MPIKGMTDRGAAFPRIGELRKGGEKVSASRPGPDLDYFRFTSKDPAALTAFTAAYGNQPRAVNCYLPYATAIENFDAFIEEWVAGGLVWRGDGETLLMWRTPDGKYSQEPKPQPSGGKQVGRLKVIVPELGRLAYVTALTTSTWDIMDMASVLESYQALRGDLRGIPFVLSRVPRMVSTPGQDGKRVRREKWLWHLEAQPVWVQAQLSAMQRAALPGTAAAPLQLTDGAHVDVETGEITEADYEEGEFTEAPELPTEYASQRDVLDDIKNHNLADVIDAILTDRTEYKHERHVLNAIAMYPFDDKQAAAIEAGKFKLDAGQKISKTFALALYDWLVARKEEPEAAGPDIGDGENMPLGV
jgi:hypothetical protein